MNRKRIVLIIQDYLQDLKLPNKCGRRMRSFDQISYSIWATGELLRYVLKRRTIPPIDAIEEFISKMDGYSCLNGKSSYIFSVAHDVAEDILDIFLAMGL